ncbi:MAG TPA: acetate/propionate family kinase [Burkholderiaceae bacterium]
MDAGAESPDRCVLALNAGSSSLKLALFSTNGAREIARGALDLQATRLELVLSRQGRREALPLAAPVTDSLQEVVDALLQALESHHALGNLAVVAHRVVHGGRRFTAAVAVDPATLEEIDALTPLAPLHQPHSVRLMRAIHALRPDLPQTASFDTAFHARQDPLPRRFALPRRLHDEGVLRYGFHGLSYDYIARTLAATEPDVAAGRVIALHLGNGASLCALRAGRSVDTSMGFSTLDGVPMGTRCGALDAGVVLYLLKQRGWSVDAVEDMLYHHSGLLGVSVVSGDLRKVEAAACADANAAEALALFALRCAGEVGRLASSLQGVDALVFTAGIGEHDARMRAAIVERLGWLGIALDAASNGRHARRMEAAGSRVPVFVIPTDEEQVIASDALALLGTGP